MNAGNLWKIRTTTLNHRLQVNIRKSRCLLRKDINKLMAPRNIYGHVFDSKKCSLLKIPKDFQFSKSCSASILETVPSSISFLFKDETDGTIVTTYPSLIRISSLVRKMNSINVDVDNFEDKLNSALKLSSHDSKNYLLKWEIPREKYEKDKFNLPIECFEKLIMSYIDLEKVQSKRDYSHILHYVLVTWRLGYTIEKMLNEPNKFQREISLTERLCKQLAIESSKYTILYFYWINLLAEGTLYCTRKASRIAKRYPEIINYFLADVRNYIDEINDNQFESTDLPKCFDVGRLLLKTHIQFQEIFDCNIYNMILDSNMALIYWHADLPEKTFSLLSKCCQSFVSNEEQQILKSHREDLIICFSEVVADIVIENRETEHHHLTKLLDQDNISPIFHYIYYLYLDKSCALSDKSRKNVLLRDNPTMLKLQTTCLDIDNLECADGIIKRKYISRVLQEIDLMDESTTNKLDYMNDSTSTDSDLDDDLKIEHKFLELLESCNYECAINMLSENTIPSENTLNRLIEDIVNTCDKNLLTKLRQALPIKTKMSDNLYLEENKIMMKEINTLWNVDKRIDALHHVLIRYELLLDDEYSIQSETFQFMKKELRAVLREFSWSLLEDRKIEVGHISNIDVLKSFGIKLGEMYQDYSILCLYFETLYFSKEPHSHTRGEEIIHQYPFLPRCLDVDAIIRIAMNSHNDRLFFKVLQFCLRFDFDDYVKSKVMEKWILHHCEKGNSEGLRKANELIIKAKELGIPVSADALQYCLELNNNLAGLSTLIMRMFKLKL